MELQTERHGGECREDGWQREIHDRVHDIFARNGAEYMKTVEGFEIRLDSLRAVNGGAISYQEKDH
jgi:hypothetical protein